MPPYAMAVVVRLRELRLTVDIMGPFGQRRFASTR
jgi:hypothetical protein